MLFRFNFLGLFFLGLCSFTSLSTVVAQQVNGIIINEGEVAICGLISTNFL